MNLKKHVYIENKGLSGGNQLNLNQANGQSLKASGQPKSR